MYHCSAAIIKKHTHGSRWSLVLFEAGSHCDTLAGLPLTVYTRLASDTEIYLLKGMWHHTWLLLLY